MLTFHLIQFVQGVVVSCDRRRIAYLEKSMSDLTRVLTQGVVEQRELWVTGVCQLCHRVTHRSRRVCVEMKGTRGREGLGGN